MGRKTHLKFDKVVTIPILLYESEELILLKKDTSYKDNIFETCKRMSELDTKRKALDVFSVNARIEEFNCDELTMQQRNIFMEDKTKSNKIKNNTFSLNK